MTSLLRPLPRAVRLAAGTLLTAVVVATGAASVPAAGAATPSGHRTATAATTGGAYVPLPPARLMDTRTGAGLPARAKIGPQRSVTVSVAGHGGFPGASSIRAVVLNLTTVNPTAATYLTVYPADVPRPATSSLNVSGSAAAASLVTVPVHADGAVTVYNAGGSIDAVLDVVGYYSATDTPSYGGFTETTPYRKFDSRTYDPPSGFLDGYYSRLIFNFKDNNGNPMGADITAVVVNVTAVSATRAGYFTVWDGDSGPSAPPVTSTVNFAPGATSSNLAVVKVGHDAASGLPEILVEARTGSGSVQGIVDVVGVMTTPGATPGGSDDARFVPLGTPSRIVDTRRGLGGGSFGPGESRVFDGAPVVTPQTLAIVGSVTLVAPTRTSFLTLWPSDVTRPDVSNVNAAAGRIVANAAVIDLGYPPRTGHDAFHGYNDAGTANLLVDAAGTFELPATATPAARAVVGVSDRDHSSPTRPVAAR